MTYHRYNPPPSQAFRKSVVRRDQQCMRCGSADSLHAHRIDPAGPMTMDNGVCVCKKCLKREHDRGRIPRIRGRAQRRTLFAQINHLRGELAMMKGKAPETITDKEPTKLEILADDVDVIVPPGDDVPVGVDQAPPPETLPEKPVVDLEAEKARVAEERAAYWRALQQAKKP